MDLEEFGEWFAVVFVLIVLVLVFIVSPVIGIFGLHVETGSGHHTGYVTAVQKNGVFFKTGRAYIKTDLSSSQEDLYCVTDDAVFTELERYAKEKKQVDLSYFSWFSAGVTNCAGEGEIINAVTPL